VLVKVHGVLVLEVEHQSWAQNMYRMGRTIKMQGGRKEIRITRGEINKAGSRRAKNMPTKNESGTVPRKEDERRSKGKAGNKVTERGSEIGCGKGEGGTRLSGKSIKRTEKRQVAKNKSKTKKHTRRGKYTCTKKKASEKYKYI
jgi:hypothetical protein